MTDTIIHEFPMLISKSSLHNGEMRWAAVNSDTDWDLYGERMSLSMFKSMIGKIKANTPPPAIFASLVTSDYWKGGMPYLSIAHYSDGNGKAVPGDVRELFIDGNQLKAKGSLFDTPLGKAVWNSLKQDEVNYKSNPNADRIRISIAFLDLAHKHGENGTPFTRKSFEDVCPQCRKGIGEKIYLDGYLVHLALTTVPVNPRTIMEAEDIMARKSKPTTRKEDAVAVVGDEALVDETVIKSAVEVKSDVMVEMSETDEPAAEEVIEEKSETVEPVEEEETYTVTKSELLALVSPLVAEALEAKACADKKSDKSMKDDEEDDKPVEKKADTVSEVAPVTKSALEVSVDTLYNTVNSVMVEQSTADEKLQKIQPVLEQVGATIIEVIRSASTTTPPAQPNHSEAILEAIQSLTNRVEEIGTEVATMKAQTSVQPPSNRVPVPRSIAPQMVAKSLAQEPAIKPGSVKDIARRSVGL